MTIDANTKVIIPLSFLMAISGWTVSIAQNIGWIGEKEPVAISCTEVRECVDCTDVDECVDGQKLVKVDDYNREKIQWVPRTEWVLAREYEANQNKEILEELRQIRQLIISKR